MSRSNIRICFVIAGVFLAPLPLLMLIGGLSRLLDHKSVVESLLVFSCGLLMGWGCLYLVRGAPWLTKRIAERFPEVRRHHRHGPRMSSLTKAVIGIGSGVLLLSVSIVLVLLNIRHPWMNTHDNLNKVPGAALLLGTALSVWGSSHLARHKGHSTLVAYGAFGVGLLTLPLFGASRLVGGGSVELAGIVVIPILPVALTLVLPANAHRPGHHGRERWRKE